MKNRNRDTFGNFDSNTDVGNDERDDNFDNYDVDEIDEIDEIDDTDDIEDIEDTDDECDCDSSPRKPMISLPPDLVVRLLLLALAAVTGSQTVAWLHPAVEQMCDELDDLFHLIR